MTITLEEGNLIEMRRQYKAGFLCRGEIEAKVKAEGLSEEDEKKVRLAFKNFCEILYEISVSRVDF